MLQASEDNVESEFREVQWCSLYLNERSKLLAGCIYRSPASSTENSKEFCDMFDIACTEAEGTNTQVLVIGEVNFPDIDWSQVHPSVALHHPSHLF